MKSVIALMLMFGSLAGISAYADAVTAISKGDSIPKAFQGIWIQKDEASELRLTGKLTSLCEEINKSPKTHITNVRLVQSSGAVYIYDPTATKDVVESLKLGTISSSGVFTPTDSFKKSIGDESVTVSAKDFVLTFTFTNSNGSIPMDYVLSTDQEARQYYAAEAACSK